MSSLLFRSLALCVGGLVLVVALWRVIPRAPTVLTCPAGVTCKTLPDEGSTSCWCSPPAP